MIITRIVFICLCTTAALTARGTLPKSILGYELQGISIYDNPLLGFSARYDARGNEEKFDVYLYTGNYINLGTGLNEDVRHEYDQIFVQIQELVKLGYYSDMTKPEGGSGTLQLDGNTVDFLWGRVQFKQTAKQKEITHVKSLDIRSSYVFVTAYEGRILKIRYTITDNDIEKGMQAFTNILNDFEKQFTKPELPNK